MDISPLNFLKEYLSDIVAEDCGFYDKEKKVIFTVTWSTYKL